MDRLDRVERLIAPALDAMGFEIVRVRLSGTQRPVLQIMAERHDEQAMTVDDCAAISRAVSAILDVEDPISGAYSLEISSPGLDRPLVKLADFTRFTGEDVFVETRAPVDGRRRFRGRLLGLAGNAVRVACEDGEAEIPHGQIQRAKLVLTDERMASALSKRG